MLFIPPTEAQFVATCLEKFLIISQDLKNLCAPLPWNSFSKEYILRKNSVIQRNTDVRRFSLPFYKNK